MKILCIAPHVPWPLHGGPQLRIYHTARVLDDRGHDVSLLAGHPEDEPLPDLAELDRVFQAIDTFPTRSDPRALALARSLLSLDPYPADTFATDAYRQALTDHLTEEWDLVLVNHLILVDPLREAGPPEAPVVLDQHESEAEIWQEYAETGGLPQRLFALQNLPKVRRARRRAWPLLDGVICVAPEEIDELEHEAPSDLELFVAPNGVDTEQMDPGQAPPATAGDPNIVFCAGMGVERNVRAARWFADEVLPLVREDVPDAKFWIVGADPPASIRDLVDQEGIEVTGTVPEVAPYYERARVAVIPNRFGGFSKLKLSEALAMGLPIVATESGAKGAPAGGELVRTADTPSSFADEVTDLLTDDESAAELASQARRTAEEELSWEQIVGELEQRLTASLGDGRPSRAEPPTEERG